jgi:hypothetical protein
VPNSDVASIKIPFFRNLLELLGAGAKEEETVLSEPQATFCSGTLFGNIRSDSAERVEILQTSGVVLTKLF